MSTICEIPDLVPESEKALTLIIKPTNACNQACSYCAVEETASDERMTEDTLKNSIEKLLSIRRPNTSVTYNWHGGEPLLMGIDFFKKVVDLQAPFKKKLRINNIVQTNGTLLNNEYASFFSEHDFGVGTSLDGPESIHDRSRKFKNGKGTFQRAMQGIKIANNYGIGGGAICVVSKRNIDELVQCYHFFQNEGIHVKLNPIYGSGRAKGDDDLSISPVEYAMAMIDVFDLWFNEKEVGIMVNPFEYIIGNFITNNPIECKFTQKCPTNFLGIDANGDVYPCGKFIGEESFLIGNLNKEKFEDILHSEVRMQLHERYLKPDRECTECEIYTVCNSGCPHDAYLATGNVQTRSGICTAEKMIMTHIKEIVLDEFRR